MKKMKHILPFCLAVLLSAACAPAAKYVTLNEKAIDTVRKSLRSGENPAYDALIRKADSFLDAKPLSVTMQTVTPPSGDKHDYMSMGPYWWPNPKTADGLPYVRRDGQHNPEIKKMESRTYLGKTVDRVNTLGQAWYFSGDEKYAAKAAELLRVFFINEETRMNPNLTYGQSIPGICTGRGVGLIDTHGLGGMMDALLLLDSSKSWTAADKKAMQAWIQEFYTWMLESEIGKDEARAKNNHGSAYDFQICAYAIYCGHPEVAREQLEKVTRGRMDEQFPADGSQPWELARTNSWGYSTGNLNIWINLAATAKGLGIDLWSWKNGTGIGLKEVVEWYFPFLSGEKPWIKKDINPRRSAGNIHKIMRAYCRQYCPERLGEFEKQIIDFTGDRGYKTDVPVYNLLYPL